MNFTSDRLQTRFNEDATRFTSGLHELLSEIETQKDELVKSHQQVRTEKSDLEKQLLQVKSAKTAVLEDIRTDAQNIIQQVLSQENVSKAMAEVREGLDEVYLATKQEMLDTKDAYLREMVKVLRHYCDTVSNVVELSFNSSRSKQKTVPHKH